jgi:hypothetical protein
LTYRDAFSNRDRDPYGLTGAPTTRGSAGGAVFDRHATIAVLQPAPRLKNHRRDRSAMRDIVQGEGRRQHGKLGRRRSRFGANGLIL